MQQLDNTGFGRVRSYLWPIHSHELKKLIPMFLMLFFVCFNYTVLRNLKDTLVVTANASGAEVIPFIKVWAMLPGAVLATMLFTYLSNRCSRKTLFYAVISFFLAVFFCFTFIVYPIYPSLCADQLANFLQTVLPTGCKGFISMVRNWPLTLFYVVAELWGTMVLTVLFWGFANEITRLSEATRFYSALNIGSNASAIIAGQVAAFLSSGVFNPDLLFGATAWEQSLAKLTLLIVGCGLGILVAFHWMTKNVLNDPKYLPEGVHDTKKGKGKKEKKMTFRESLSFIAGSKYLLCIAAIVISYNLVIHMVEVLWKDRLHQMYPDPHEYNIYINNLTSAMGIISTSAALAMVGIIRKLGWTKTALVTPIVLLVTTAAFFTCLIADETLSPYLALFLGTTPLALAVLLGSVQNCFTKAAKYSLFDVTKEMAFIPLSPEQKLKGKAAIDGIGSRLGKSGGSVVHQGLMVLFCSLSSSTPYVAAILFAVIILWIVSVKTLGAQFQQKADDADETISQKEAAGAVI
ncbi:MAG: NTP/NDP exchange transporter [Verrucomicrobia bacterium]|nr:NTP/NDP exchange transporter [Verrucomicrobiota bacterium]